MTSPMHHGARLSLLGLRSNLPTGSPPPDRTYRIGPGGKLVSEEEVLEHLAFCSKAARVFGSSSRWRPRGNHLPLARFPSRTSLSPSVHR
jgi:hypothetical protein